MNERPPRLDQITQKTLTLKDTVSQLATSEEDPPVGSFFATLSKLWEKEEISGLVKDIFLKRPSIEPRHLAYLLFISAQHETQLGFDNFHQLEETEKTSLVISTLKEKGTQITHLCKTKNASTNIVERYAGLQIILAMMQRKFPTVIDLGTGLGLGLTSLNHSESFSKVTIEDVQLHQLLIKNVPTDMLIGIDEQPRDFNQLNWHRACLLPGYRHNRPSFENAAARLISENKISFIPENFLQIQQLVEPQIADIIWTSNVLYIVGESKEAALARIQPIVKHCAKPGAIYIDADYRSWDDFSAPENPYVYTARFVNDWENPLEVLQAPSLMPGIPKDAVLALEKGKDFDVFTQTLRGK